jgi:hypothetical protein
MISGFIRFVPAAFLVFLSGCATAPTDFLPQRKSQAVVYPSLSAQAMTVSNSAAGRSCEGQDHANSLRLSGHSRYYVRAAIETRLGIGFFIPYHDIVAPADESDSRFAKPEFAPRADCGGASLWVRVVRQGDGDVILWRLEMYPIHKSEVGVPMQPYLVHGEIAVDEKTGTAQKDVGFHAFDRDFLAHIRVTPGPVFSIEQRAEDAKKALGSGQTPSIASPLPDELPYRTLDDVTVQH